MTARIDKVVTSGTFSLDGGTWDVDNNVWLIGDDDEVLVIDAAHDAAAIAAAVAGRRVVAILSTHGHDDHIDAAPELAELTGAPILLHPADAHLWGMKHRDRQPDSDLWDGQVISVGGVEGTVRHTARPLAGRRQRLLPIAARRFHRRHAVQGGPGGYRPFVLRFPDHHRLGPADAGPAG